MKKFILLLIILASGIMAAGQNSIYLTYRPNDMGIGARIERVKKNVGIYVAYTRGEYSLGETCFKKHNGYSIGIIHNIEDYSFISAGMNYNYYSTEKIPDYINPKAFKPISIELGTGIRVEWFVVALRIDIIKWEPVLDTGINFYF